MKRTSPTGYPLDNIIATLRREIAAANIVRTLQLDPEMAKVLIRHLRTGRRSKDETITEIVQFFIASKNKPATYEQITAATGSGYPSVAILIRERYSPLFEVVNPGGRPVQVRLTKAGLSINQE